MNNLKKITDVINYLLWDEDPDEEDPEEEELLDDPELEDPPPDEDLLYEPDEPDEPDEKPEPRPRKALEEIVYYEKFGKKNR